MTQIETATFPVQWEKPSDADLTWSLDHMHSPGVGTPLGFDLSTRPFVEGFGMLRASYHNYYTYYARTAPPAGDARKVDIEAIIEGGRRWREVILPEVRELDAHYLNTDFDALSNDQLVAELDKLVQVRRRCGQLHTMCTMPWWTGMEHLLGTFHDLTGGDDLGAMRIVQGYGNKSVEAGKALCRLSRLAADTTSIRDAISADELCGADRIVRLDGEPDAAQFLHDLDAFLDEFGWRSSLFEFAAPTWREDPTVPLNQIRAYLDIPDYDPDAEQKRLAEERDAGLEATLASLSSEDAARLQASVDAAAQVAPILEDHNYYIDQRVATLPRRLVLAAGRRLVSGGRVEPPDDAFYLRHAELRAALLGELADATSLVENHKAGMEEWSKVTPPESIGAPPPVPVGEEPPNRFWGGGNLRSDRPGELKGHAASAGVVRGPARVIASLDEAHRLKRGDVLVTKTTMPPWTPLFAVAAAVVTETGGVLSHSAVTAREYGLPAVLSIQNATRLIRDGQALEVDGSAGIVRILT